MYKLETAILHIIDYVTFKITTSMEDNVFESPKFISFLVTN